MNTTTASGADNSRGSALPSPLYAGLVMALTVFFCGLLIWPTPVGLFTVGAVIHLEAQVPAGASPQQPRVPIERQQVADAIRATDRHTLGDDLQRVDQRVPEPRLEQTIARLDMTLRSTGASCGELQLQFQGTDQQWSRVFLGELVRQLLSRPVTMPTAGPDDERLICQARWRVEQARHYERKARFDLEGALVAGRRSFEPEREREPEAAAVSRGEPRVALAGWPAQPAAADAQLTLAPSEPTAEVGADQAQLLYDQAVFNREQAEQAYFAALAQHRSADAAVIHWATSVAQPVRVVAQVGGRCTGAEVITLGALALLAAAMVHWRVRSLDALATIDSIDDLQRTIAAPVIGRIAMDPMSAAARRRGVWGRLIRGVVRGGELTLFLLVTLFLVSALSDSAAGQGLRDNPLDTFTTYVLRSIRL